MGSIIFDEVHSDERRTIYGNVDLLDGREVSIIELKKGKAIGGCLHHRNEYYCVLRGDVLVLTGSESEVKLDGEGGMFPKEVPHGFIALEDSLIMEWGISPEEKKDNPKDEKMLEQIKGLKGMLFKNG